MSAAAVCSVAIATRAQVASDTFTVDLGPDDIATATSAPLRSVPVAPGDRVTLALVSPTNGILQDFVVLMFYSGRFCKRRDGRSHSCGIFGLGSCTEYGCGSLLAQQVTPCTVFADLIPDVRFRRGARGHGTSVAFDRSGRTFVVPAQGDVSVMGWRPPSARCDPSHPVLQPDVIPMEGNCPQSTVAVSECPGAVGEKRACLPSEAACSEAYQHSSRTRSSARFALVRLQDS